MKYFDNIIKILFFNEETEFNLEEEAKKSEQIFQEMLKNKQELRGIQKPIFHFIYRLNFQDGSIFNLEDLQGWFNFTNLHYSMYYRPTSHFPIDLKANSLVENTEIFFLPKIIHHYFEITGRCEFEGIQFDVWTNGLDFEIVLDEKALNHLDELPEIFGRWTSHILLDSLDLTSKLDNNFKKFISVQLKGNIHDHILNLEFYSFIIITFPETQEYQDYLEDLKLKKLTEKIWINEGVAIKDRNYPPFQDFRVYLLGHVYEDIDSYDILNTLICHLKFWSMFHTLDNFAGLLTSIKEVQVRANVKKSDFLKSLFGRKIIHKNIDYLDGIKYRLDRILMFGLGDRSRGFEYDESDAFLIRKIAGEYLILFNKNPGIFYGDSTDLTKKIFINFNVESEEKLIEQYQSLIKDLKERINETILSINRLENNYYRSYELGLNLKAQELTLISIVVAILAFTIQFII